MYLRMSDTAYKMTELVVDEESISKRMDSSCVSEISSATVTSQNSSQQMPVSTVSQFALKENSEGMKRNDSFAKFGHMETISLDASEQDTQNIVSQLPESSDVKKPDGSSIILEKSSFSKTVEESGATNPRTQSAFESKGGSEPTLSKYFSLPVDAIQGNGLEFFDALPAVASQPKFAAVPKPGLALNDNPLSVASDLAPIGLRKDAKFDAKLSESAVSKKFEKCKEMYEVDGAPDVGSLELNIQPNTNGQTKEEPVLFKLFANDSSGGSKISTTFFDEIANERDNTFQTVPIDYNEHTLEPIPHSGSLSFDPDVTSLLSPDASFLSSVKTSGGDQMYDAWLPSERTQQILVNMVTSSPGTYFPDKDELTMPGIIIEEDMADPVTMLLLEANSPMADERRAPSVKDVTEDEKGLKELIAARSYHAAINLTTRLLTAAHQGPGQGGHLSRHTPLTLQLWFTRLALFVKLRKFPLAEVESEAFGALDKPDLYYEFYPDTYSGRKGSMVPFSFRILLAELPEHQGNHQVALDNLYSLLTVIQKMIRNLNNGLAEDGSMIELTETRRKASLELWEKHECRVLYSILNCILLQKDYVMAISVGNILIQKDKDHARHLLSAMGRIFLQLGDVKGAENSFSRAALFKENSTCDKDFQVENLINNALLSIAHNELSDAYEFYQKAYVLEPANTMLANNMAVCLLYMGRLKESLALLERTVQNRPQECLHEGILFNTCTLYELESSRSTLKKFAMLNLISTHAGDDFNVTCLKISSASKV